MNHMNFDRLSRFLSQIPSIGPEGLMAHGSDGKQAWWIKFYINIEHPLAWQTVQELGHVLNYLSTHERLPSQFLPVSPPPYMNGDAKAFLAWVIETNHADFPPDVICDWLEGRLPNPVADVAQWRINTQLDHDSLA
jgi:hypothetical protein